MATGAVTPYSWFIAGVAACLLLAGPALARAAGGQITSATARLDFSGDVVGPETMTQLQQALDKVVQAALLDQLGGDLAYISANKKAVITTLGDAISATLHERGFDLQEMSLDAAEHTVVHIELAISHKRVQEITVRFFILGNTDLINAVTGSDAAEIATALNATIARTPVGDLNWLHKLVRAGVEEELAKRPAYADFVHEIFIEPGEATAVVVAFTPQPGTVLITGQRSAIHSVTLLNTQLDPVRDRVGYLLSSLIGAPRNFLQAKQQELSSAIFRQLVSDCHLLDDCPDAALNLTLDGCELRADSSINSTRSLAQASVRLDLRGNDNAPGTIYGRVRVRGGMIPQAGWAVYGGADYYPGDKRVYPLAGVARLLGGRGYVGAGYDFQSQSLRLEGQQDLSADTYVSADYYTNHNFDRLSELALHWRLHRAYELQLASSLDGGVFAAVAAAF